MSYETQYIRRDGRLKSIATQSMGRHRLNDVAPAIDVADLINYTQLREIDTQQDTPTQTTITAGDSATVDSINPNEIIAVNWLIDVYNQTQGTAYASEIIFDVMSDKFNEHAIIGNADLTDYNVSVIGNELIIQNNTTSTVQVSILQVNNM
jgi:hypothetical protein